VTHLRAEHVTAGYGKTPVIHDISLDVPRTCLYGIIGPNGAGKTTLFKCLSGILKPWEGSVWFGGNDIRTLPRRKIAQRAAYIPQFQWVPFPYTVEEFVLMGRYPHRDRFSALTRKDRTIVEETLEMLDLLRYKDRRLQSLSGGELQRVFLAQGLTQRPELILMDEPTAHLDISHQVNLLDMLKLLRDEYGLTVVLILHDLNIASAYCDTIALMSSGRVHACGSPEHVLTATTLEEIYQVRLVVERDPLASRPHIFFVPGKHTQKR